MPAHTPHTYLARPDFVQLAQRHLAAPPKNLSRIVLPLRTSLLDDQLTPVLAYRRLVAPDQRTAASFLFESVEGGERQGRYSILGAQPTIEIVARGHKVTVTDLRTDPLQPVITHSTETDPLEVPRTLAAQLKFIPPEPSASHPFPKCFIGGWAGFAGYDTVRYAEPERLSLTANQGPKDDRNLPDLHLGWYDGVVIFDHVQKLVHVITLVEVPTSASPADIERLYDQGLSTLERRVEQLQTHVKPLISGRVATTPASKPATPLQSNLTQSQHADMVARAKKYIAAGDIFQVVLGQRFEKRSHADPFDVYRALRAVNPSPYMVYMQGEGTILIAASPEILCRVRTGPDAKRTVTNRPLAGTRKRGSTPEEDLALEKELLADPKEVAEHVMLVDLARNDVGQVAVPGTINIPSRLAIERYSHVMHISSTVTGQLRPELDAWDALRAALPVGTISGAPKIRAMQIIDELEPIRRGPYGGGMGYVGLDGDMDMALALRTIVVPTAAHDPANHDGAWLYHLQASGGIVADSETSSEYQETVNKSAAMARALELAEQAFI